MNSNYQNELNKIKKRIKTLKIISGIFFIIWLPFFVYSLWIDWFYIQNCGIFQDSIQSLERPDVMLFWLFILIMLIFIVVAKISMDELKEIEEKKIARNDSD